MSKQVQYSTAAAVTAAVVGGAYYAYRLYQETQPRLPDHWTPVGTLKELCVYPVKSCRAVAVDKMECTLMGLKSGWLRDRALMVVDEASNFITARVYPELLAVLPALSNATLSLSAPGVQPVLVNLADIIALQDPKISKVWGTEVPVYDCGDEVAEWLSKIINRPSKSFRLVYYASHSSRKAPTDAIGKVYKITDKDTGAFSDDTSFNLINEASVADLNTRLGDTEVTTAQLRPNFVLSGPKAYAEDNWKFVKIGENIFEIVMPCTRCVMTTIDPESGVRDPKNEPLNTLKGYRLVEGDKYRKAVGTSPRMGIQLALRSKPGGVINLNDAIYVA